MNVDLRSDKVAVLLGATLHHCTAGLLRPSLYRVVRSTLVAFWHLLSAVLNWAQKDKGLQCTFLHSAPAVIQPWI